MSKQITISDIKIKEISSSNEDGLLHLSVWYALVDQDGNEVQDKRDLIVDGDLIDDNKTNINNLLTLAHDTMKSREQI